MKPKFAIAAGLLLACAATPLHAAEKEKKVSAYLQCDGNPNNMSAGEGIARFIGAVTLLGIFAPMPETPSAEARLFAEEGVAACTTLIDGEKGEGNVARRLPLIVARAIHRIEAKDYEAALVDIAKARGEANTAGLDGDIYFDRSFGQSLDRIQAAALVRLGRAEEAKAILFAKAAKYPHSYFVVGSIEDFVSLASVTEDELAWLESVSRIDQSQHWVYAARLQLAGKWQESVAASESYLRYYEGLGFDEKSSEYYAAIGVANFIAGNRARADELIARASANFEDRRRRGVPEADPASIVEILDFYEILKFADRGEMKQARLRYGARSQWTAINLAQRLHASRLLREGADPSELTGALAVDEDAILAEKRDDRIAELLAKDKDNDTLFRKILPYANVADFEALSKRVWGTDKSKLLKKEADKAPGMFYIEGRQQVWQTQVDSMLLHSALLAKARGKAGFEFWMEHDRPYFGFVRFRNPDDPGISPSQYFDADKVIAELREAIPSPDELKARKKKRGG